MTATTQPVHTPVLIIGGGFAGLYAALGLAKHGHEVTLVERNSYQQCCAPGRTVGREDLRSGDGR